MLKRFLDKTPRLKKIAKLSLEPILKKQDERRTAAYNGWLARHQIDDAGIIKQRKQAESLKYRPLFSIIAPAYNTPEVFLREMIESVLTQTYDNWELIIVDDASPQEKVREIIQEYASKDRRIKNLLLTENHHIAGATNEAIKISSGDFISLFDHDDLLRPDALFEIAKALNGNRSLDFIYTDEDKFEDGEYKNPFFKPDWNPDFLRSVNYITHFTTIRKTLLDQVGYEDGSYNGAQDWELYLRITRHIPEEKIHHIPKVLYSWRIHDASTSKSFDAKPYVVEAQRKAIMSDLEARGCANASVEQDATYPGQWRVVFKPASTPKIAVVITGKDAGKAARIVKEHTNYKDFDVVTFRDKRDYQDILAGVAAEYVVFADSINIRNIDPGWLEEMLGDAERADIGFVVAEHGDRNGVARNISNLISDDIAAFASGLSVKMVTKHLYTFTRYNIPEVEQGVVMVKMSKLREAIGDKRGLRLVDVSGNMQSHGYRNLYNPYVRMVK